MTRSSSMTRIIRSRYASSFVACMLSMMPLYVSDRPEWMNPLCYRSVSSRGDDGTRIHAPLRAGVSQMRHGVAAVGLCSWDRFLVCDRYPGPGEFAVVDRRLKQAGGTTANTCAAL